MLVARSDVVIVGAGAAGLATAIFTRQQNAARSVVVLEGARKPGAKILVSGGGRCNVTNAVVNERDFWGGRAPIIRRVLRGFPVDETIAFFERIGVGLHQEAGGKLFPDTHRARDVLDALLNELTGCGASLLADHRVTAIVKSDAGFVVTTNRGAIHAARVVLATGGRSLPKTGSDGAGYAFAERLGHSVVDTTPALAPLVLADHALGQALQGVAHDVELSVWSRGRLVVRLSGALLWTHFGISGPVALNASRHWIRATDRRLTLNFCPDMTFDQVDRKLTTLMQERPRAALPALLAAFLPASVARAIVVAAALDPAAPASRWSRDERRRLSHALTTWELPVVETRGYTYAEVTAGGVKLDEIDPATLESRVCPGLFLVGEILDVDGRIGGFNFQWAWATARIAARGLANGEGRS